MAADSEETILHFISDYTEKSDAVIGALDREATRPFKAQLAKLGGKFNMSLKDDRSGERVPGWIFSIKSSDENDVKGFVDKVNSGEIEGDSSGGERTERSEHDSGRRSYRDEDKGNSSSNKRNIVIKKSMGQKEPKEPKESKGQEMSQSIDVKVSPSDFESIRRKKKTSILIYIDKKISIVPGYSFNLVEYDLENNDEDNLIRLRKTTTMVVTAQHLKSIKDNIQGEMVVSLDIPSDDSITGGYWFVLYF